MIEALKKCYPAARIDFLVHKRVYDLVSDYPGLNKVHALDEITVEIVKLLSKSNEYDLAIAVHPRFTIALGLKLGGVKYRLGTGYRWYSFLFNIKHFQHRKNVVKHELEYNIDLLSELGCEINYFSPVIEVKQGVINEVDNYLTEKRINKSNYIVIHIPSLGSAKVWSDDNFAKLINMIAENMNVDVVLTGTENDSKQINNVNVKNKAKVFAVTDLNLNQLAALLKMAKLFIGNSTGPIHIAAAVGTFCIGLYSPVKVESSVRWGPYTDKKKVFQPERDNDSRDVMNDIKPEEVFEAVKANLKVV